jgi:hypothetical protein
MKLVALALLATLAAGPVAGDEPAGPAPEAGMDEGLSLVERGARLMLRDLLDRLGPALDEVGQGMERFAGDLEPVLRDLARLMGDAASYHAPEVLPNGDILIRRRRPGEPEAPGEGAGPEEPGAGGAIDL